VKAVVIDTNVLAVANECAKQAGPDCVLACVDALETARAARIVVVDSKGMIFAEYFHHANRSGQPGVGDAFARWLHDHQAFPAHCEQVEITPSGQGDDEFAEFPKDEALRRFHRKDRKFVAVALASAHKPFVLNATDLGWWSHRGPLERNGVRVEFLCPDLMIQ